MIGPFLMIVVLTASIVLFAVALSRKEDRTSETDSGAQEKVLQDRAS